MLEAIALDAESLELLVAVPLVVAGASVLTPAATVVVMGEPE